MTKPTKPRPQPDCEPPRDPTVPQPRGSRLTAALLPSIFHRPRRARHRAGSLEEGGGRSTLRVGLLGLPRGGGGSPAAAAAVAEARTLAEAGLAGPSVVKAKAEAGVGGTAPGGVEGAG